MNRILILEDDPGLRQKLKAILERAGFTVDTAATTHEAQQLVAEHLDLYDVALLDVVLEGETPINGLDFGVWARERSARPPEFLVMSAYPDVAYYDAALKLGAAAYLPKPVPPRDLLAHLRALCIRRALQDESEARALQVRSVGEHSFDQADALHRACREMLLPDFAACLRAPFVVWLSGPSGATAFAHGADLPDAAAAWAELGEMARQRRLLPGPAEQVFVPRESGTAAFPEPLASLAACVFLGEVGQPPFPPNLWAGGRTGGLAGAPAPWKHYITLGIWEHPEEDARTQAEVLAHYCRRGVRSLASLVAAAVAQRQAVLRFIADYSHSQGKRLLELVGSTKERDDMAAGWQRVRRLGQEWLETGEVLAHIAGPQHVGAPPVEPLAVHELLTSIWSRVAQHSESAGVKLALSGEGQVSARRDYLVAALARVLTWLAVRAAELDPPDNVVDVECRRHAQTVEIVFTNRSPRLPASLRAAYFRPFSGASYTPAAESEIVALAGRSHAISPELALYLSQVLIQAQRGSLEDESGEEAGRGHRFVVRLPHASEAPRAAA
jgi:CheY-like chemotaxis protein